MALGADLLVEGNDRVVLQHRDQLLLGLWHLRVLLDLKDGADEDSRVLPPQMLIVPADHVEKSRNQTRIRIELDVRGEDEVGVGRLAGDVPSDVDRIVKPR